MLLRLVLLYTTEFWMLPWLVDLLHITFPNVAVAFRFVHYATRKVVASGIFVYNALLDMVVKGGVLHTAFHNYAVVYNCV